MAQPAHTLDAFHRGYFWLVQPKGAGHRAGVDAMMLAAAVPSTFSGRLADFGAGAGAAGLAVASRLPNATVVLVENSAEMARFASLTLEHPKNARLEGRACVLVADVTLAGGAREKAGLANGSFDYVIMNPPFNAAKDRATPDALKQKAHVMEDGLFESLDPQRCGRHQAAGGAGDHRAAGVAGAYPRRTRRPLRQRRNHADPCARGHACDKDRGQGKTGLARHAGAEASTHPA